MALYQKFRPQKFNDVVGQDHIVYSLSGAILSDRISHAYLFTGPRGLGKTTLARLMAKAINCQNRKSDENEPCGKCQSCLEISNGSSLNVIEIDAASNRGIDEIRDLKEKIRYLPSGAKFKIYIIDEVHMLTEPAFNALLKTIEEPPAHAIFILATTDLHKVPLTIVSRCQKFDFHRAGPQTVKSKLDKIVKLEKFDITPDGIDLISRLAEGSFRDGESILEQISSVSDGQQITSQKIENLLGISPKVFRLNLLKLINTGKIRETITLIEQENSRGCDMKQLNIDLIETLRQFLLAKVGVLDIDSEEKEVADMLSIEQITYLIERLIQCGRDLKNDLMSQLPLEMALIEFINKYKKDEVQEDEIKREISAPKIKEVEAVKKVEAKNNLDVTDEISKKTVEPIVDGLIDKEKWLELLEALKPLNHSLYTIVSDSNVIGVNDGVIKIEVKFKFHADRVNDKNLKKDFDAVTEKIFGRPMRIQAEVAAKVKKEELNERKEDEILGDVAEVFGVDL
ncbi:MAG: DNA polymerase III subunit gamma/tau [Patescibacteria group bacterium]